MVGDVMTRRISARASAWPSFASSMMATTKPWSRKFSASGAIHGLSIVTSAIWDSLQVTWVQLTMFWSRPKHCTLPDASGISTPAMERYPCEIGSSQIGEAAPDGNADQIGGVADAKLLLYAAQRIGDGLVGDPQCAGDLGQIVAFGQKAQNFQVALGEGAQIGIFPYLMGRHLAGDVAFDRGAARQDGVYRRQEFLRRGILADETARARFHGPGGIDRFGVEREYQYGQAR